MMQVCRILQGHFSVQKWPMGVTVFPPLQIKLVVKNIFSLVKSNYFCCVLFLSTLQFHTLFQPNLFYPGLIYTVMVVGVRYFFLACFLACFLLACLLASFIHHTLFAVSVQIKSLCFLPA